MGTNRLMRARSRRDRRALGRAEALAPLCVPMALNLARLFSLGFAKLSKNSQRSALLAESMRDVPDTLGAQRARRRGPLQNGTPSPSPKATSSTRFSASRRRSV